MKYTSSNKPLVCMQTQSTCYKSTKKMSIKGVLLHCTGANNPALKRYVQPSDTKPSVDTYNKTKWLEVLGKNIYNNDWNHIEHTAGVNGWIGKLADGTVTTVQTMPWDYRPWGCNSGDKGSCNDGWIQIEICEDALTDKTYFNKCYTEVCELIAYLCKTYNIDPKATVTHNNVKVPTILCHQDSYKLGLGSNHADVYNWFNKYNKTMDSVRNDVAALLNATVDKYYRVRKSKDDVKSQVGAYASLDNAKAACQKAGPNYSVFDWNWKIVYSYSEIIMESEKTMMVYDLDYPNKVKIIDKNVKRTNADCVKAIKKIISNNTNFDPEIVKAFFELSPKYHVDPMMAVAQSILETGWFKYEYSAVTPDQHNYCGMGVTQNGMKGASFDTIQDGVIAQLQHLYAYGCKDELPKGDKLLDPRFSLVTRGVATYWQQLAGRWAYPGYDKEIYDTPEKALAAGNTYGQKILARYDALVNTSVTNADIEKYFPTKVEKPVEPEVKEPVKTEEPTQPEQKVEVEPTLPIKPLEKPLEVEHENKLPTELESTEVNKPVEPDITIPAEPEIGLPKEEEIKKPTDELEENDKKLEERISKFATLVYKCLTKFVQIFVELLKKGE